MSERERENGGTTADILKNPAVVKAVREAYVRGAIRGTATAPKSYNEWEAEAERRYPMPRVEVPRVVSLGTRADYRVRDGIVETRLPGWDWMPSKYSVSDLRNLGDLAANPTETREVEE